MTTLNEVVSDPDPLPLFAKLKGQGLGPNGGELLMVGTKSGRGKGAVQVELPPGVPMPPPPFSDRAGAMAGLFDLACREQGISKMSAKIDSHDFIIDDKVRMRQTSTKLDPLRYPNGTVKSDRYRVVFEWMVRGVELPTRSGARGPQWQYLLDSTRDWITVSATFRTIFHDSHNSEASGFGFFKTIYAVNYNDHPHVHALLKQVEIAEQTKIRQKYADHVLTRIEWAEKYPEGLKALYDGIKSRVASFELEAAVPLLSALRSLEDKIESVRETIMRGDRTTNAQHHALTAALERASSLQLRFRNRYSAESIAKTLQIRAGCRAVIEEDE